MKRTSMQNLSSMMDEELAREDLPALVRQLGRDDELQACWENYHLIGDALRKNLPPFILPDLQQRISTAIQNEPAYFLPQQTSATATETVPVPRRRAAWGFALAASVTALAMVGMMQFNGTAEMATQAPVAVASNEAARVALPADHPAPVQASTPVVHASVTLADAQSAAVTPYQKADAGVDYPGEAADLYDYLVNYQRYTQTVSVQSGFHPAIQLVGYTPQ